MNLYDECLDQNPLFRFVQENHNDIIKKAIEEDWIICIPRIGTFDSNSITNEDIFENILIPNTELPVTHFSTLTKQEMCVIDRSIVVNGDYSVQILFEETYYVNKHRKYKLWCIERPLNMKHLIVTNGDYVTVKSARDCIKLLWTKDRAILNNVNKLIECYLDEEFQFQSLETLIQRTKDLFKRSVDIVSVEGKNGENIRLAVETYIQQCVHLKLLRAITNYTARYDANLNKIIRNLSEVQIKDLDINAVFADSLSVAKRHLANFGKTVTVLGKVECLRHVVNLISNQKGFVCVTTDDLLKSFVLLVIKSNNVSNWIANLSYISQFRFCSLSSNDESSFLITTLEAAIEYIRKGEIKVTYRFDNDNLSRCFTSIRDGDMCTVKKSCSGKKGEDLVLCHPLCVCDKCTVTDTINVNSCNDKGWTALHVSCLYDYPHIVEYLLKNGAKLNVFDDLGLSPLHYAALKGHQNALLLLLHADATTDVQDSNGNTPLHLAVNNGHENCVKALLYFKEHKSRSINANIVNNVGDSPLHLSVKWGYLEITSILLQYGANPNVRNKWNRTAFDIAHNDYVKDLLIRSVRVEKNVEETKIELNKISSSISENLEQMKKIDLLLKSIKNNDLPLMCYYLGVPSLQTTNLHTNSNCHPLCTCDSCQIQFENSSTSLPSTKTTTLPVNTANIEGFTPLHVAAKYGRLPMVRLLLDKGALINTKTRKEQLTPLHLACKYNRIQVVRELLKCGGCNADVQDIKGNTPLHYACIGNEGGIVELLLSHECDISVKNANEKTALKEAHSRMYWNVVKLFKFNCNNNDDFLFVSL
ncbi:hypothetical protein RI129_009561 [Pyrocoelia pectoralis]|uniref:VPS9 domain-containing protein n=1 Tax=Pyrocoelia pectoralis TaxID=417401 RepID=A0AAN7VCR8_9COLE